MAAIYYNLPCTMNHSQHLIEEKEVNASQMPPRWQVPDGTSTYRKLFVLKYLSQYNIEKVQFFHRLFSKNRAMREKTKFKPLAFQCHTADLT
jgi:hypothetical protein